eukprot:9458585-Ditylum_brightwellii.AAC.1
MLGVTLVLDDSSVGAISFISCMAAIKEHLEFLKVIFNLLLLKCILVLMAFWLVAKDSLHILLISQPCNCDIEISAVKMVDPFLMVSNIGIEHHICWLAVVAEL